MSFDEQGTSESSFRLVVEAAPNAMILVGQDGRIVYVNSQTEKLFGFERRELLGQPIEILIPTRFRPRHSQYRDSFFSAPQTRSMGAGRELFGLKKDGAEVPIEIGLNPLKTTDGAFVLASIIDVTERSRAEADRRKAAELEEENRRIAEANRLKSEFLANMSHEIRTPLNAVIGFSEILFDGKAGPVSPDQKEYLGDILTSSRHLLQLINDVLDLAKLESGKMTFAPEDLSLPSIVDEVSAVLGALSNKKRIEVGAEIDPSIGRVVLDSARLKQVLFNYLSNAIKFTLDGGRIRILARAEQSGYFRLAVQDSGIGIRPEDLRKIFVEFTQLEHPLTKKQAGTGLGLALTKKIVEAQGGRVGVESVYGQGSVFYAVLPRDTRASAGERA